MNNSYANICLTLIIILFTFVGKIYSQTDSIGQFKKQSDIGNVKIPGYVKYDPGKKTYLIGGSGTNMWFGGDEFHYLWKKSQGDISLSADIEWTNKSGNPHKKACLIIRQSLDTNSVYADVALHAVGLTSLQYRSITGGPTREIQSNVNAPGGVMIRKHGDVVSIYVAPKGEKFMPAGGSIKIDFKEPFYIGLGVCSHDNNVIQEAVFSNVKITEGKQVMSEKSKLESTLEIINIESLDRRVVYNTLNHIEAPNWSRNGKYFLFNSEGKIFRIPVEGGNPSLINTGFAVNCNNDHGISPDGKQLVISDQTENNKSMIYILPIDGGTPKKITENSPSYWHGWSPDGKTLAYCAERNGNFDIYTIPIEGGSEKRLTAAKGLDDGPEYSPDGQYLYFNSDRTGLMQIWRMKTDGSMQEQVTHDDYNNWFPHFSPDGKWIVFLTYNKDVEGHPPNKDVMLRLMPADGSKIQVIAKLFGGQGTINVPSWSPNSKNLAFVSYTLIYP